ncbi:monofunctional biosynthetic peptidoglycan transglycosylase [Acinetobacter rathckeae]|uniref:monofunctional biosynthetic peptidoglycan transglycosylase n=1 Tax=Acinetobacter rathckeae TaxID=2605272 RepID=UPI0018A2C207|nr:monofunctional biosynthetic peptidoglycan transglycosylase [Acinetobacter rathckeae]MBF7687495.1 monofunctional biosynthetic peptidoglycan transglycosylase [Acinetobacter rathckeae]MBF7694896.1 monofunctional biosynthetic peptidoglycan transglycosylase [Acinetobacter rathckeae]
MRVIFARFVFIVLALLLLVQIWVISSLYWWKSHPVETTMFMRIALLQDDDLEIQHQWVSYDHMGTAIKKAVIASEDGKFTQHHGFDWNGLQGALARNEKNGEVVAGGSTITQQLAKNLFLYNQRSYIRKAQEAVITVAMESMWSKQRILEVYLNSVEFGRGIYGIEAASRHYFHCSSRHLSTQQAMFLAALLPNPKYYQTHKKDAKFLFRQRFIAKYMTYSQIP